MNNNRWNFVPAALLLPALAFFSAAGVAAQDNPVGEALTASVRVALYNTLTVVSLAADIHGKKLYTDEQILSLLLEQKKFMSLIGSSMRRLAGKPPHNSPGDAKLLETAAAAGELSVTIDALTAYIQAPSKPGLDAYLSKRQAAAVAVKKALGG